MSLECVKIKPDFSEIICKHSQLSVVSFGLPQRQIHIISYMRDDNKINALVNEAQAVFENTDPPISSIHIFR